MMKFICLLLTCLFADISLALSQTVANSSNVANLQWATATELHLTLSNDSSFILDAGTLPHSVMDSMKLLTDKQFIYYPATLDKTFIDQLKGKRLDSESDSVENNENPLTLWSTIHHSLGGGWAHFINSLLYSLQSKQLLITSPLMVRPQSKWKPDPVTETYKRTKKWDYYIPVTQKEAKKEYYLLKNSGQLQCLEGVPAEFVNLFLNTSERKYLKMKKMDRMLEVSRIDLVKIMLGARYMSSIQINYIKNVVLKALNHYSVKLPSVIILDNFRAAIVISLEETGYKIEKIVFSKESDLSYSEILGRKDKIYKIIEMINEINRNIMQESLQKIYNPGNKKS